MPATAATTKILRRFKGLQEHLQEGEEPLRSMPAIWDNGEAQRSVPCDVILTNRRLLGYQHVRFPRERLFLDSLELAQITTISLRERSHEPLFRELLVDTGRRRVYIRAPRKQIETLSTALREVTQGVAPEQAASEAAQQEQGETRTAATPAYEREEIQTPFERSPLGMLVLFVGGIALEIVAVLLWFTTQSLPTSLPPLFAGLLAVFIAFLVRRQRG